MYGMEDGGCYIRRNGLLSLYGTQGSHGVSLSELVDYSAGEKDKAMLMLNETPALIANFGSIKKD